MLFCLPLPLTTVQLESEMADLGTTLASQLSLITRIDKSYSVQPGSSMIMTLCDVTHTGSEKKSADNESKGDACPILSLVHGLHVCTSAAAIYDSAWSSISSAVP